MKYVFIAGGVALVAIGTWWTQSQPSTTKISLVAEPVVTNSTDPTPNLSVFDTPASENTNQQDSITPGTYQPYSPAALAASTAEHNVLIFSATWCPSCRALDADITKNIADLPGNVALFTIDYDANTALRQQYNVTTQHTLVLVETDGSTITSWRGGNTLASILSNL